MNANALESKGSSQSYPYNHNSKTYSEVGKAIGQAMADVL